MLYIPTKLIITPEKNLLEINNPFHFIELLTSIDQEFLKEIFEKYNFPINVKIFVHDVRTLKFNSVSNLEFSYFYYKNNYKKYSTLEHFFNKKIKSITIDLNPLVDKVFVRKYKISFFSFVYGLKETDFFLEQYFFFTKHQKNHITNNFVIKIFGITKNQTEISNEKVVYTVNPDLSLSTDFHLPKMDHQLIEIFSYFPNNLIFTEIDD